MGIFSANFDPKSSVHDQKMARFMQPQENIYITGFGSCRMFMFASVTKGKIYVTNLRTVVILDDARIQPIFNIEWSEIANFQKKLGFGGGTVVFEKFNGSMSAVDSTKAIIKEIENIFENESKKLKQLDTSEAILLREADAFCSGCSMQLPSAKQKCPYCLRIINWTEDLKNIIALAQTVEQYIPEKYPDGKDTGRDVLISGTATLAMAAKCQGLENFVSDADKLATAIREKNPVSSSEFMEFPIIRGVGDQTNNKNLWNAAKALPFNLFGNVNR